jgi:Rrf2 family protein
MVTQTGKYALRILGYLADHPGEWVLGRAIAADTGIPANYLSKILNQLRKAGFVLSQKGWGGGFFLHERAARRPIGDVLELFEGQKDNGACVFDLKPCDAGNPCPLHNSWDRVRHEYETMVGEVVVGNLRHTKTGQRRRRQS